MRWWMPEEPDVRLVPPERACCKQIHNGFGASKSINRLSNDRLEQQISCVWGSTEPISCQVSFTLNILIFCLVLRWAAPQVGIQLLQDLAWFCTGIFFFPGMFYFLMSTWMLSSSLDILLDLQPTAELRGDEFCGCVSVLAMGAYQLQCLDLLGFFGKLWLAVTQQEGLR